MMGRRAMALQGEISQRARRLVPVVAPLLAAASLALMVGCTPLYRDHGYVPPESELAQLQVGVDTRESVIAAVGAPGVAGLIDETDFYYIESRFRHFGFLAPEEIDRTVLAISFDGAGALRNIERFGLANGQVVVLSRRVTTENVRDTTFVRQLLRNLGRVDAETLFGE